MCGAPPPAPRLMMEDSAFRHSKPATGQRAAAQEEDVVAEPGGGQAG